MHTLRLSQPTFHVIFCLVQPCPTCNHGDTCYRCLPLNLDRQSRLRTSQHSYNCSNSLVQPSPFIQQALSFQAKPPFSVSIFKLSPIQLFSYLQHFHLFKLSYHLYPALTQAYLYPMLNHLPELLYPVLLRLQRLWPQQLHERTHQTVFRVALGVPPEAAAQATLLHVAGLLPRTAGAVVRDD